MGLILGMLFGGVLVLGAVGILLLGVLSLVGQAAPSLPKGVSLKELGFAALVAVLGVAVTKLLAIAGVVPDGLVRYVATEGVLMAVAAGVGWVLTNET